MGRQQPLVPAIPRPPLVQDRTLPRQHRAGDERARRRPARRPRHRRLRHAREDRPRPRHAGGAGLPLLRRSQPHRQGRPHLPREQTDHRAPRRARGRRTSLQNPPGRSAQVHSHGKAAAQERGDQSARPHPPDRGRQAARSGALDRLDRVGRAHPRARGADRDSPRVDLRRDKSPRRARALRGPRLPWQNALRDLPRQTDRASRRPRQSRRTLRPRHPRAA